MSYTDNGKLYETYEEIWAREGDRCEYSEWKQGHTHGPLSIGTFVEFDVRVEAPRLKELVVMRGEIDERGIGHVNLTGPRFGSSGEHWVGVPVRIATRVPGVRVRTLKPGYHPSRPTTTLAKKLIRQEG